MIWATLALLGIPIWLLLGAIGAALFNRRRFMVQPDTFKLKIRDSGGEGWQRSGGYGRVVHDVVVVNRGMALVRTSVNGIRSVSALPYDGEVKGLEPTLVFAVELDRGDLVEIAIAEADAAVFEAVASGAPGV